MCVCVLCDWCSGNAFNARDICGFVDRTYGESPSLWRKCTGGKKGRGFVQEPACGGQQSPHGHEVKPRSHPRCIEAFLIRICEYIYLDRWQLSVGADPDLQPNAWLVMGKDKWNAADLWITIESLPLEIRQWVLTQRRCGWQFTGDRVNSHIARKLCFCGALVLRC